MCCSFARSTQAKLFYFPVCLVERPPRHSLRSMNNSVGSLSIARTIMLGETTHHPIPPHSQAGKRDSGNIAEWPKYSKAQTRSSKSNLQEILSDAARLVSGTSSADLLVSPRHARIQPRRVFERTVNMHTPRLLLLDLHRCRDASLFAAFFNIPYLLSALSARHDFIVAMSCSPGHWSKRTESRVSETSRQHLTMPTGSASPFCSHLLSPATTVR